MAKVKKYGAQGATFGVIEATIMMLGVMLGLSVVHEKTILILGIVAAGVADAVANSAAFHISEETEGGHTQREVWRATFMTFVGTAIPVILMLIPLIFLPLNQGIIAAAVIAVLLISIVGSFVASQTKLNKWHLISEYLIMGLVAVVVCFLAGKLVQYLSAF